MASRVARPCEAPRCAGTAVGSIRGVHLCLTHVVKVKVKLHELGYSVRGFRGSVAELVAELANPERPVVESS